MLTTFIAISLLGSLSLPADVPMERVGAIVSGYTSLPELTDSEPFIMANGERVYWTAMACPIRYKFGTIVSGLGENFICSDRMNARYRELNHFDIYFPTLQEAKDFGRQKVDLYIYEL